MTQSNKRPSKIQNVTNEGSFPEGFAITYYCETRLDNTVPNDEKVATYLTVNYSGIPYSEGLKVDPTVKFQNSGVKGGHFESQDHFREWAEENATAENPHNVHFTDLGKQAQFMTKAEKLRKLRAQLKAMGITSKEELEAIMKEG